jgi:hypothetical protein
MQVNHTGSCDAAEFYMPSRVYKAQIAIEADAPLNPHYYAHGRQQNKAKLATTMKNTSFKKCLHSQNFTCNER